MTCGQIAKHISCEKQEAEYEEPSSPSFNPGFVTTIMMIAGLLIQTSSSALARTHSEHEVYFGETHLHTSSSLNSYLGFVNTITRPEEFYNYSPRSTHDAPGRLHGEDHEAT
ncbi:MAG: DUF3604 domain-containing protein [Nitrospirales bacterium]|nr:hypothetical protein [Nitrospira sp.]MDR4462147.1 DUF3604 domain-containing protein [Nitrospirales bacterium]MDR4482232.1 DUF3604 domain-containing protein [Nitrospirales bacterium]